MRTKSHFEAYAGAVLGVDPAARSGWGVVLAGNTQGGGSVDVFTGDGFADVCEVIKWASELARESGHLLLVAAETWPSGGPMSIKARHALASAWGVWHSALAYVGSKPQVTRVLPVTWRGALGIPNRREQARATAFLVANNARRQVGLDPIPPSQHDQAEGECIALWGTYGCERTPSGKRKKGGEEA